MVHNHLFKQLHFKVNSEESYDDSQENALDEKYSMD